MRKLTCGILLGVLLCAGPAFARQGGPNVGASETDPLARALETRDVYVGKQLRSTVSEEALQRIVRKEGSAHRLKIAVVNLLPPIGKKYGTRDAYTKALHDYLNLGRGMLLIATSKGVSAATPALSSRQITLILARNKTRIHDHPVEGIAAAVQAIDAAEGAQQGEAANTPLTPANDNIADDGSTMPSAAPDGGSGLWWLLPVGILGAGGVYLGSQAAKKTRAMNAARQPLDRLRSEVVAGISYADNYLDLLPSSPQATSARQSRQEAAAYLEQAREIAMSARTPGDYARAEALLELAGQKAAECRSAIDIATGGTGFAVAVDGTDAKATPLAVGGMPQSLGAPVDRGLRADNIPPEERAACFFCSRPARITDLTPVTIAVDGRRRKVLACAEDVAIIQRGSTPEIRLVSEGTGRVPWFQSRGYDPYRDYNQTNIYYTPGYAGYGGYDGGWMEGYLLGSILSQPVIAPYPIYMDSMGNPGNDMMMGDPSMGGPSMDGGWFDNSGGGAWSGSNGTDSGANVGGADYGDNSGNDVGNTGDTSVGGADYSSSDSGGGSDFGSSDSGGSDSGGDSGGGGDY